MKWSFSSRWEMIWWTAQHKTSNEWEAQYLVRSSVWLYEPSLEEEPVYIVGSIIHRNVNEWLHENNLESRLRNGFDLLIFEDSQENMVFNIVFGENIKKFGQD